MKECALEGNLIAVNIRLYAMKVKNRVNIQGCESRIIQQSIHIGLDVQEVKDLLHS